MKRLFIAAGAAASFMALGLATAPSAAARFSQDKLDATSLKTMVEGLGYEIKPLNQEAGKEKYEFKINKGGFDIPVAAEVSPSTNYVWLTVYLGEVKSGHKADDLLRQNTKIQPCQFYISTKNGLMMGIAIDNRQVNAAVLRRNIEKITDDVSNSASLWQVN